MSKRKKRSKIGLVIIMALFVYFAWTVVNQQQQLLKVNNKINEIKSKISQEKENNKQLVEQKKEVLSDKNIEKVARERFGMVKQGEQVFIDINK
jgi:cell division protein FtsB